ncbi:MAG: LuxR family transcriptional regulator [Bacteroidales bacterium]|nr:LuxR family transcriptional regulator [Bacteroidales bacterium]
MRKIGIILLLTLLSGMQIYAYNDHRGHNLDSLERAVARWTPDAVDKASDEELVKLNRAYRDLMLGYNVLNGEKSLFYARKALSISRPRGWYAADSDAYRYIGQIYYGREQYDSARVYYLASLAAVDAMAAGATSPTNQEGYTEREIDDYYSALYGSIGNLYNMMDSIPQAMQWYGKAGVIFEKYGWNESNSVLHYNMGETWMDEGDLKKARTEYDKAMAFAESSGDSLMIVQAWKGYGRYFKEKGRTRKSLSYLRKADAYYAAHPDFSPEFRTENLDVMKEVLSRQKLQLGRITGVLVALVLAAAGLVFSLRKKASEKADETAPAAVSAVLEETILEIGQPTSSETLPQVSEREKEILDLLTKGYTTPQIAGALGLSPETVKWYRKKLLVKFDVSNTAELISQVNKMMIL